MNQKHLTAGTPRTPRFFLLIFSALLATWRFDFAVAQEAPSTLPLETQMQIEKVLDVPNLRDAHVGISILDLGLVKDANAFPAKPYIGKPFRVLFERAAQKKFMPASNMKLFTAAIALQLLGKDKTFPTKLEAEFGYSGVQNSYTFQIIGGGDPSLSQSDISEMGRVAQPYARSSSAPLFVHGDGSMFSAETFDGRFPFGWTLDDTQWYYGPEISALALDRNQLDVTVTGAAQPGATTKVEVSPNNAIVINLVKTGDAKTPARTFEDALRWHWRDHPFSGEATLILEGEVAPNQVLTDGIALPDPSHAAAMVVSNALSFQNLVNVIPSFSMPPKTIAAHNSPPLSFLFQRFLKNSDNLYAEMLLRDAAYYFDGTGGDKAGPRAHELLKAWLIKQNIDVSTLRFEDGSGLSRYDLLTPRATAELLAAINRMKDGDVIYNALPIAGVDGTMKDRMKTLPALNNVRAKSGTFSIASNLSGYVTTRDGHRLAVALFINFARNTDVARAAQDQIYGILAGASWKGKP